MNLKNLTTRAKFLLAAIVAGALSMQVDQVKDAVTPYIANHPKLASIAGAVFSLVTLLQNPTVQHILGIDEQKTVATAADGTTISQSCKTTTIKEG